MKKIIHNILEFFVPIEDIVIRDKNKTIARLQEELNQKSDFIHIQYQRIRSLKKEHNDTALKAQIASLQSTINSSNKEFDSLQKEYNSVLKVNSKLKDEVSEKTVSLNSLSSELDELKIKYARLNKELDSVNNKFKICSADLELQKKLMDKLISHIGSRN